MTMENKPLLQVKDLTVTFGERHNKFTAVKNVSFDIFQGETFGLVGESGSGKTTIGRTVIRINPAASGEILYDGERISGRISREKDREVTRKIQMIFQDPMASLNERAKVDYIVSEGLYNLGGRVSEEERRKKVAQALSDVGLLPEFASRFPHEFSGGQRQRIGIARALIMGPHRGHSFGTHRRAFQYGKAICTSAASVYESAAFRYSAAGPCGGKTQGPGGVRPVLPSL